MKIGIVGPNKIFDSVDIDARKKIITKVAEIIAKSGSEINLTPDKNSLLEFFGKEYLRFGGKKIQLILPTEESDYDSHLNTDLGEIISCKSWDIQADEFNRQSDLFICIGYAWGGMKEISCAQYYNKKKIYIINEFISQKLPDELNFLVEYINIEKLPEII